MSSRLSFLVASFLWIAAATPGQAATFQTDSGRQRFLLCYLTLGTPDPPVMGCSSGSPHPYEGPALAPGMSGPGVDLASSSLRSADLSNANLAGARFSFSDLSSVDFSGSNLVNADLSGARFRFTNVEGADLSGADLSGAGSLGLVQGSAIYSPTTDFTNAWWDTGGVSCLVTNRCTPFDPVDAGWTLVVPEPATALLLGLGLLMLGVAGRPQSAAVTVSPQSRGASAATSSRAFVKRSTMVSRSSVSDT